MLYLLDKALSKMSDVELKAIMCDVEIPGKQKIVNYLKSFEKNAYTTQPVIDVLTGENSISSMICFRMVYILGRTPKSITLRYTTLGWMTTSSNMF